MTTVVPASPKAAPLSFSLHVATRLVEVVGHENALAGGEAVGLDDVGRRHGRKELERRVLRR